MEQESGVGVPGMDQGSGVGVHGIDQGSMPMSMPTFEATKEMEWYIERKIGSFDGSDLENWKNFVKLFESVCAARPWGHYPDGSCKT